MTGDMIGLGNAETSEAVRIALTAAYAAGIAEGLRRSKEALDQMSLESSELTALLANPIADLELTVRTYICLAKAGHHTIGDLLRCRRADLLAIPSMDAKGVDEIAYKLQQIGGALKP
jgi:DNA-directed RNA polymerase subunit alpha